MGKVVFYVKGMHCASCELIIEKKALELQGVNKAEANQKDGTLEIYYERAKKPKISILNNLLKDQGYVFYEKQQDEKGSGSSKLTLVLLAIIFLIIFFIVERTGVAGLISINSQSSLGVIFFFGLAAGLSSCAALVGGLVLSMSKQWNHLYEGGQSFWQRFAPHWLFNIGRLLSYSLFGGILGSIGGALGMNVGLSAFIVILVSVFMFVMGLNMVGIGWVGNISLSVPKFLTRYFTGEKNFQGRYMPFVLGAGTFFIPCGFTISAQGVALLSGSFWLGVLVMLFFALGTMPVLLLIGLSSVKIMEKPHLSNYFLKVAGFLVLFFALFNINSQLNVLGLPSLNNITIESQSDQKEDFKIVDGKQLVNMQASAYGYSPDYIKLKTGVPVEWIINSKGVSGCTNAIIAPGLIEGSVSLVNNQETVVEFTPKSSGKYKFSCWMGMVTGVFEVVD
ncbi:sulfite exporter TauE/SafE family protein [Patescibacteria group bacterium]|nr:sulfite exporter TauE/SafE family protein [Patescibacteria group bacterium]